MEKGESKLEPIAEELKLPYKTIEWNLKVLEKAGLVSRRVWGGIANFSLAETPDLRYNSAIFEMIKRHLRSKKR